MNEKRKVKPITILKRIGLVLLFPVVLLGAILFWIFLHEDGYLAMLKIIIWACIFAIVGLLYLVDTIPVPTPFEQYEETYKECLSLETLTEIQCNNIALETID